jgi:glycosyltransferase involved in cell wall biosynthesis
LRGGTSRHLSDVVGHTDGVTHHVVVPPRPASDRDPAGGAVYDHAALEAMVTNGAVVHHLDMRRRPWEPANAAAVGSLHRLIGRVRPGVVHGHSSVGGALARMAGRAAGVPVAYTANGVATAPPYRLAERALGPITWRWVAVSESEAALARRWGLAGGERLVTIPNGIEPVTTPPPEPTSGLRASLGLAPDTPVVGTVARLVAQKAPGDFVRVCAEVATARPDTHFALIGMGPLQDEVDAEVARAGLGRRWHQIAHIDRAEWAVADMTVFVLVSRFEGAPYTPLEAMRAEVPVVLTDVVGSRDCVEDGRSGLLRPAGDVAGLAEAVVGLLDDAERRRSLGMAGRMRVAERFDVARMGRSLSDLYRSAPPVAAHSTRRRTLRLPQPRSDSSRQRPDSSAAQ